MADSTIDILIKTTGDPAGAQKVAAGLKDVDQQTRRLNDSQKVQTRTQQELQTTTRNTGQAIQAASYALQDFAYAGVQGAANNLPQLLQGLGMGAGLGGVLSVVALAASAAAGSMDLFGTEAAKAKKEADALTNKLDEAARNAREHAAQLDAVHASTLSLDEALRSINETYTRNVTKIDEAAAALKRQADAAQALEDAQRRGQLADTEIAGLQGKSPAEVETERRRINQEFDKKKFERDQRNSQNEVARQADIGNEASRKAVAERTQATELEMRGRGVLKETERDRLKTERTRVEDDVKNAQKAFDAQSETIFLDNFGRPTAPGGPGGSHAVPNPAREAARQKLQEEQRRLRELNDKQEADENAQRRLGKFGSEEKMQEEVRRLRQSAKDEDEKARKAYQDSQKAKDAMKLREQLFPEEQSAANKESEARIIQHRNAEEAKAQREREQREREAEREREKQRREQERESKRAEQGRLRINRHDVAGLAKSLESLHQKQGGDDAASMRDVFNLLHKFVGGMQGGMQGRTTEKPVTRREFEELQRQIERTQGWVKNLRSGN